MRRRQRRSSALDALEREDRALLELFGAIPVIERAPADGRLDLFADEGSTAHSPLQLHPGDPRWYERAPVASPVLTWYAHRHGDRGLARREGVERAA